MADKEAMQLGSRLHRKIQARMGGSYQAEVPMKYQKECISLRDLICSLWRGGLTV